MPMRLIISRDSCFFFFFFNDTATTEIYTLSLHDALPILRPMPRDERPMVGGIPGLGGFFIVASHSGVTLGPLWGDRKSTRLNSSHGYISYAVFCLKKKKKTKRPRTITDEPIDTHVSARHS